MGLSQYQGLEYQVNWSISIIEAYNADCRVHFVIRNPLNRLGTLQGSLELYLPSDIPASFPEIKVDEVPFTNYDNNIVDDRRVITIFLKDIISSSSSNDQIAVDVHIQLDNVVKKFGLANIFSIIGQARCGVSSDHPHRVKYNVQLPIIRNKIFLFIASILGYLEVIFRGSEYPKNIYQIETNAENPHIDYERGSIEFSTSEKKSSLMIMYSTLLDSRRFILILGAILGVIATALIEFIFNYGLSLIKNKP